MWIVYCLYHEESPRLELFCFSQDFTTALDAMDDYAITKYRLAHPDFPKDQNPLDEDAQSAGYSTHLELDMSSINPLGDAERILLKEGERTIAHYQVDSVGKYVDDYTRERTQAVAQLEKDAAINFDQEILEQATSSSEEDEEEEEDEE